MTAFRQATLRPLWLDPANLQLVRVRLCTAGYGAIAAIRLKQRRKRSEFPSVIQQIG